MAAAVLSQSARVFLTAMRNNARRAEHLKAKLRLIEEHAAQEPLAPARVGALVKDAPEVLKAWGNASIASKVLFVMQWSSKLEAEETGLNDRLNFETYVGVQLILNRLDRRNNYEVLGAPLPEVEDWAIFIEIVREVLNENADTPEEALEYLTERWRAGPSQPVESDAAFEVIHQLIRDTSDQQLKARVLEALFLSIEQSDLRQGATRTLHLLLSCNIAQEVVLLIASDIGPWLMRQLQESSVEDKRFGIQVLDILASSEYGRRVVLNHYRDLSKENAISLLSSGRTRRQMFPAIKNLALCQQTECLRRAFKSWGVLRALNSIKLQAGTNEDRVVEELIDEVNKVLPRSSCCF